MIDRQSCPVCAHSIRFASGRLVEHADPRFGRTGDCPGSGVECKQDPGDAARRPRA